MCFCLGLMACGTNYRPKANDVLGASSTNKDQEAFFLMGVNGGMDRSDTSSLPDLELGGGPALRGKNGHWSFGGALYWDPLLRVGTAAAIGWKGTQFLAGFGFFPLGIDEGFDDESFLPYMELSQHLGDFYLSASVDRKLLFTGSEHNGFVTTDLHYDPYLEKSFTLGWDDGGVWGIAAELGFSKPSNIHSRLRLSWRIPLGSK